MTKSATDVMQEVLVAAVLDALGALKDSSKGMPNTLLRDLNAIHANTTFADLPREVQASVSANVRAAFTRLLKEGYSVAPAQAGAASRPPRPGGSDTRPSRPPRPGGPGPRGPRRDGPSSPGGPVRRGGRPPAGGGGGPAGRRGPRGKP